MENVRGWRLEVIDYQQTENVVHPEPSNVLADAGNDRIVKDGQAIVRLDADGIQQWRHQCNGQPDTGYVSGDRLLVLTLSLNYHAWGLLGPALLLDVHDGRLITELRGNRAAPLNDGQFVLGLEGYDVFDTWFHDKNGTVQTTWRSYGHYVPDRDGTVRVVECDRNNPTASRVVQLLPGGGIKRGPCLSDGQVAEPVVLADGTLVVLDSGVLRAVDRNLHSDNLANLLRVPAGDAHLFHGKLTLDSDLLTVTVDQRDQNIPMGRTRHKWTLAVRKYVAN